jgi:hypothetical protein
VPHAHPSIYRAKCSLMCCGDPRNVRVASHTLYLRAVAFHASWVATTHQGTFCSIHRADVRVAQFIPASAVRCSIRVYILLSVALPHTHFCVAYLPHAHSCVAPRPFHVAPQSFAEWACGPIVITFFLLGVFFLPLIFPFLWVRKFSNRECASSGLV